MPLPDDSNASAELAAEYAAAREREGRVMAILRALGPRADVVRALLDQTNAALFNTASLSRREPELLAVAPSEANGAAYSHDIHAALLDEEGGGPDGSPRDRALVEFARRLTLLPREGSDAVADLSEHLSPDEVYDAIVLVAHMNTANRVVLAAGIAPDDDLY